MNSTATKDKYSILIKYKSRQQKQRAIDKRIDIIAKGSLPPYELEEAKEEATILAESLLRCPTQTPNDHRL